jgi:hypothetical protein
MLRASRCGRGGTCKGASEGSGRTALNTVLTRQCFLAYTTPSASQASESAVLIRVA